MHIALLLYPGTMASSVLGLSDVLVTAAALQPGTPWFLQRVAATRDPQPCFGGTWLEPDATIDQPGPIDLLLVPSLALGESPVFDPVVLAWLHARHATGTVVASVCTGAFLLAAAGLLDGRMATTHWVYAERFRQRFPQVLLEPSHALVDAGSVVTAGAGTAWQDLLLQLLRSRMSDSTLLQLRQLFLLQGHEGGQRPYCGLPLPRVVDARVQAAAEWLRKDYREDDAIVRVQQRSGLKPRTFQRRFRQAMGMTAVQYLQGLRMEAAKELLLANTLPVEAIGEAVGYGDSSFFRRLFRRHTGLAPGEYRRRYAQGCTKAP